MADAIGTNHGIEAVRQNLQRIDTDESRAFGYDRVFGEPGKRYSSQNTPVEGTLLKLVMGHNEVHRQGGLADTVKVLQGKVNSLPFPFEAVS